MVQVKDLTELKVADLWSEVKDEEDWWADKKEYVVSGLKRLLEQAMEEELIDQLGAARYRRCEERQGYRNGSRYRNLQTEYGLIEHIRVPRDREGLYQPTMLARYQRRQGEVNDVVRETFLAGVSTRRIGKVLAPVLGRQISAQQVSRISMSLEAEVRKYHERLLVDQYQYLFLDGISLRVKGAAEVKKRLVLCAYGINALGQREMISFRQATSESAAQWETFLRDLYRRGVEGRGLNLIVTDGCAGLDLALDIVYPYVKRQRCWAHKLRNVAAKLPLKYQEACLTEAKKIYQSKTKREASGCFKSWAKNWQSTAPNAVACLRNDLDDLLNFLGCPPGHWKKVRTTNVIERAFREVRRRTRPMSCFQNSASVDRIIYGVIHHLNQDWKEKPLKEFTHNS